MWNNYASERSPAIASFVCKRFHQGDAHVAVSCAQHIFKTATRQADPAPVSVVDPLEPLRFRSERMAMPRKHLIENVLENALFASRWLMAPFYVGLVLSLAVLMIVFFQGLLEQIPLLWTIDAETGHFAMREEGAIMLALSLIDISLAGNLVLIVIFA